MDETPKASNATITNEVEHNAIEPVPKQTITSNEATSRDKGKHDAIIAYSTYPQIRFLSKLEKRGSDGEFHLNANSAMQINSSKITRLKLKLSSLSHLPGALGSWEREGIIVVESIKGYCDHNNAKDFQSRDSVPIYYQYVIERLMRRKSISLLIHIVPPRSRRVTALEDQELELLGKLNEWNATIFELEPGLYKDCHDFDMNKMHGRFEVLAHFLDEEGDTQDDVLLDHDDEEHTGSTQRCKGKEKIS
ncbi:hypothetical protein JHK84_035592 [Glycine max]|nr:hypothetical protein JHK86_035317 [Glycine max]KAG5129195.1 hypothetical protein JHK84_035592 [Glycine max]